MYYSEYII